MDVLDKPADPKEVELTEVDKKTPAEKNNKKRKKRIINVKITFCTHVGWDGVLVMLFSLGIAGLFVYITFLYTKKLQLRFLGSDAALNMERDSSTRKRSDSFAR